MRRALTELGLAVVMLVLAPASVHGAEPLDPDTTAAIHDYVAAELAALGVPGAAVAVVRDDEIVFAAGFGQADGDGREVTPQTPFDLASVSKMLTAIAVFQQVEAGNLALDDRVQEHLSWFGDQQPAFAEVTVRDLLGHGGGWSLGDGQANLADEYQGEDAIERNARRLAATAPTMPRGTFEYSNANYDVLAHLVEVVSEVPFAEYMESRVFEPLEMRHAHASREAAVADGMARGFYPFMGVAVAYEVPYVPGGSGSGFLHASAEDLGHALIFHLDQGRYDGVQVLARELVAELHGPIGRPDSASGYGGGLWSYPLYAAGELTRTSTEFGYDVPIVLEHGGDHASAATMILALPEERLGVAVLMNMNDGAAPSRFHQMHYGIANLLLGLDPPATLAYEDVLNQYVRLVVAAVVVLQVIGVAWALRRIRAWRRLPSSRPRGTLAIGAHLVPAFAIDLAVTGAFWWLIAARADAPFDVVLRYAPDIALFIILISILGIGWGIVRTLYSVRALRAAAS